MPSQRTKHFSTGVQQRQGRRAHSGLVVSVLYGAKEMHREAATRDQMRLTRASYIYRLLVNIPDLEVHHIPLRRWPACRRALSRRAMVAYEALSDGAGIWCAAGAATGIPAVLKRYADGKTSGEPRALASYFFRLYVEGARRHRGLAPFPQGQPHRAKAIWPGTLRTVIRAAKKKGLPWERRDGHVYTAPGVAFSPDTWDTWPPATVVPDDFYEA